VIEVTENTEKKYLIGLDQLKQLCLEKTTAEKKMEIQISVLANPYHEPQGSALVKGGKMLWTVIDRATDHQTKKKKV
jgi:hypothetical protein